MRYLVVILFSLISLPVFANTCSTADVAPLVQKMFSSLGHDCSAYASLFASDAQYYHQHDGYKVASELENNCRNYAGFCPGNDCKFQQNGELSVVARRNSCEILVPYLWSELPANHRAPENLEPHTGWEFIIATPSAGSGLKINRFAELESSYSVAFNWAKPGDTPAVVAESTLRLLGLPNSASKGECNSPIAPVLTSYFDQKSRGGDVWRQQGDAIVLAAGGICHIEVPYSAQIGVTLKTGRMVFALQPDGWRGYRMLDAVEFERAGI